MLWSAVTGTRSRANGDVQAERSVQERGKSEIRGGRKLELSASSRERVCSLRLRGFCVPSHSFTGL